MKLKEEYQKLNETMPSMTMQEKLKEIGKKFIEVLIELFQWPVLDKEELESRLGRIRADLVQAQKVVWKRHEKMKKSQDITQEFK